MTAEVKQSVSVKLEDLNTCWMLHFTSVAQLIVPHEDKWTRLFALEPGQSVYSALTSSRDAVCKGPETVMWPDTVLVSEAMAFIAAKKTTLEASVTLQASANEDVDVEMEDVTSKSPLSESLGTMSPWRDAFFLLHQVAHALGTTSDLLIEATRASAMLLVPHAPSGRELMAMQRIASHLCIPLPDDVRLIRVTSVLHYLCTRNPLRPTIVPPAIQEIFSPNEGTPLGTEGALVTVTATTPGHVSPGNGQRRFFSLRVLHTITLLPQSVLDTFDLSLLPEPLRKQLEQERESFSKHQKKVDSVFIEKWSQQRDQWQTLTQQLQANEEQFRQEERRHRATMRQQQFGYIPLSGSVLRPVISGKRASPPVDTAPSLSALKEGSYTVEDEEEDDLIPIRIELELESPSQQQQQQNPKVFRETFTWPRINTSGITPEQFAACLCQDFSLPNQYVSAIAKQIQQHLDDDKNWRDQWRTIWLRVRALAKVPGLLLGPNELRVVIKLDITVGNVTLIDQFEWDLAAGVRLNDPDRFAEHLAADLGLGGEFRTAIAHSIREQWVQWMHALIADHFAFDQPGATPNQNVELADSLLPPVTTAVREEQDVMGGYVAAAQPHELWPAVQAASMSSASTGLFDYYDANQNGRGIPLVEAFTPHLILMDAVDRERLEVVRERDARRKRRLTRGRGTATTSTGVIAANGQTVAPLKTMRTLLVSRRQKGSIAELAATVTPFGGPVPYGVRAARITTEGAVATGQAVPLLRKDLSVAWPSPFGAVLPPVVQDEPMTEPVPSGNNSFPFANEPFSQTQPRAPQSPIQGATSVDQNTWRCSNCGCRASETTSARRGPDGEKTQCNSCGSFWISTGRLRPLDAFSLTAMEAAAAQLSKVPTAESIQGESAKTVSAAADALVEVVCDDPKRVAPFPDWFKQGIAKLHQKWPHDRFLMVWSAMLPRDYNDSKCDEETRQRLWAHAVPKIQCPHCDDRLYIPGPYTTLCNFENHIRSRAHRASVEAEMKR